MSNRKISRLDLLPATEDVIEVLYRGLRMDTLEVAQTLRLPESMIYNALAARDARGEVAHAG